MTSELPNIDPELLDIPTPDKLAQPAVTHKPRILLLYGSNRARSYSRLLTEEAARLLQHFGADTRIFNSSGLPLPDDAPEDHPKVQDCASWCCGARAWSGARRSAMAR
jgi:arsenic resistance protein ArsH